jgi:TetR/AcrR family transcriptional repressor of nem operon
MPRPRKFAEAEVIAAARDQFWKEGYAATSLDDLTAATGLGRGSFYGAFGDKHALFIRVLTAYCEEQALAVRAALKGSGSPCRRLVKFIRQAGVAVAEDTDRRGCLMAKSAAELAATDTEVAQIVKKTIDSLHASIRSCIEEGQFAGELDPTADATALAGTILALVRGLEALGKAGASPELVTSSADELVRLLPRVKKPA